VVQERVDGERFGGAVTACFRGLNWLGGRDLNPDNVVQRALNVFRCALVRSVMLRLSPTAFRFASRPFRSVLVQNVSLCLSIRQAPPSDAATRLLRPHLHARLLRRRPRVIDVMAGHPCPSQHALSEATLLAEPPVGVVVQGLDGIAELAGVVSHCLHVP